MSNYRQRTRTLDEYQVGTFVDLVTEKRPLAQTHLAQVTSCFGGVNSQLNRRLQELILKQLPAIAWFFLFLLNVKNVNAKVRS